MKAYQKIMFCLAAAAFLTASAWGTILPRAASNEKVLQTPPPVRAKASVAADVWVQKLDLNSATREELMELPGIGEARAEAILEYRAENGKFYGVEELLNITGIGEKSLEKLRGYVMVD